MPRQKTVSSGVVSRTRRPKQPEGKAGVAKSADVVDAEGFGDDPAAEMVPATDEPITPVSRAGLRDTDLATDLRVDVVAADGGDDDEAEDEEEEEEAAEAAPEHDDFKTVLHTEL